MRINENLGITHRKISGKTQGIFFSQAGRHPEIGLYEEKCSG